MITQRLTQQDSETGFTSGRVWRYGPLIVWMIFIFFVSGSHFSAASTSKVIRPLVLALFPDISEVTLTFIHFLVRKSAHFGGYAILGFLACRAFLTSSHTFVRQLWFPAAFLLIAVYALLDEYHQSFVASRTASFYDSVIDLAGGCTALIVVVIWRGKQSMKRSKGA